MTQTCSVQNLGVDLVGQQTQNAVRALHSLEELSPGHRFIGVPLRHLTPVVMEGERDAWDGISKPPRLISVWTAVLAGV